MKPKILLFIIALLAPFSGFADSPSPGAVNKGSEVRLSFDRSQETPNSLVFREYLSYMNDMLAEGQEAAKRFIMYSMELPDTSDGHSTAELMLAEFEAADAYMKNAVRQTETAHLCPGSGVERTSDQIYQAMDVVDDKIERIADQGYAAATRRLSSSQMDSVLNMLAEMKHSFTYVKLDHKIAWESAGQDQELMGFLDEVCAGLVAKQQK